MIRTGMTAACLVLFVCGCGNRYFTNIGNSTGVPTDSIDAFASENDVSRDEAKARIADQLKQDATETTE